MIADYNKNFYLLGAGGHAKILADIITLNHGKIAGYNAPDEAPWLENIGAQRISETELNTLSSQGKQFAIGFVGLDCEALKRRHDLFLEYSRMGASFPTLIHPTATISPHATIAAGVQINAHAIINASAHLSDMCIANTGSIVEHDAYIGTGSHIAPRALVLGGAHVEEYVYLGAGCIVIQGTHVEKENYIKSMRVYNGT